ncbi:MAG: hypothetical protein IT236_15335 [Bacteroidia bacterium]|nr:hypothetical protein [Bacteroidia bacterium]
MNYSNEGRNAGFTTNADEKLREENQTAENKKGIENHIKAGEHFGLASRHHYEAAKFHEEGHHEKANQAALYAIGHANLAVKFQIQDTEHHILETGSVT